MIKVNYEDNKHGTIIKTIVDEKGDETKYAYDIVFWRNISTDDSIVDYCYSQFEENLTSALGKKGFATNQFCSGTCAAMILAITYGDKKITPLSVLLWGDETNPDNCEYNWNGELKKWEQDDYDDEAYKQVYDNRWRGKNGDYGAIDGNSITTDEDYLKNIKIYLSAELPVIIEFPNQPHFVVVVGVESNVKLEDATLEQLVIFDPDWKDIENEKKRIESKIITLGESKYKNARHSYRLITPYPIVANPNPDNNAEPDEDENGQEKQSLVTPDNTKLFVADENGNKTHDPYYIDPVRKSNGKIIPAKQGRALKEAIKDVDFYYSAKPDDKEEKDKIIEGLKKLFTGEYDDVVYENLTVTENGEYEPDEDVTAFDKVVVDVKANVKSKDITANGEYRAVNYEAEGFDVVNVNVPDRGDEAEKYKKLWEAANDKIINVDVHIPDPSDPGNPNSGINYVFENAMDIGENVQPNEFLPLLIKKGKTSGDIVDIKSGLSISYTSGAQGASLTITNLHNGKNSTWLAELNWVGVYTRIASISVGSDRVNGSAVRLDDEGREITGQGMYLYFSSIGFTPPADWKPYYIVV